MYMLIVIQLAKRAGRTMDATSMVMFKDFWEDPKGKEYREHNFETVKGGVHVKRCL